MHCSGKVKSTRTLFTSNVSYFNALNINFVATGKITYLLSIQYTPKLLGYLLFAEASNILLASTGSNNIQNPNPKQ